MAAPMKRQRLSVKDIEMGACNLSSDEFDDSDKDPDYVQDSNQSTEEVSNEITVSNFIFYNNVCLFCLNMRLIRFYMLGYSFFLK